MLFRSYYVTGCRDKGAPTDEAAAKVWERAINRIMSSCGFERPKSESESAKRMAAKRAEQAAKYADQTDGQLIEARAALLAKGDSKSIKSAMEIVKEIERREKPVLDAAATARKAVLDKLYVFGNDVGPANDTHRFFLDDSSYFGPRLKTYELRVLNWAYVTASSSSIDNPMRKIGRAHV